MAIVKSTPEEVFRRMEKKQTRLQAEMSGCVVMPLWWGIDPGDVPLHELHPNCRCSPFAGAGPPRPFLRPAMESAKQEMIDGLMAKIYGKMMKGRR